MNNRNGKLHSAAGKNSMLFSFSGANKYPILTEAPLSPSRNCFVPNPSTGQPCARSLTCKTHSMGAKRAVPRAQPFDILLHEWQKTNRPELVSDGKGPVRPRVGLGSEEYQAKEGRKRKKGDSERRREREERTRVGERDESEGEEGEEVDSEEEVESVMKALGVGSLGRGRPLGLQGGGGAGLSAASLFVGRNAKLSRLRSVLGGVSGLFVRSGPWKVG